MDSNPRAAIGGNVPTLDDAISTFDFVGFLLARHETLILATRDDRLDRACIKVLGCLIATMNRETRTSWVGREAIASDLGMAAKTVSNYIHQLKCLGYLVSERRPTPQANNRVLMHYTLSKLQPAEIESAIERALSSIRGERDAVVQFPPRQEVTPKSSRPDRNSHPTVPVLTGTQVPAPAGTQQAVPVLTGTKTETIITSSCQDGRSKKDSLTTKNRTSGERGVGRGDAKSSRLSASWTLPRPWGVWAAEHFEITRDEILAEAAGFRDYWTSLGNTRNAAKSDWAATWRNWVRNSRRKYRLKSPETGSAYDLGAVSNIRASDNETMRKLDAIINGGR